MSTTTSTTDRRSIKMAGSVVVVGVAAALAGLGTFGGFTDTTAAVDAGVDTGVLSIDVSAAGSSAPLPVSSANLLPGGVTYLPMDLRNGGDVGLASVTLDSYATVSSRLDTDAVHGLQLRIDTCPVAWVGSGTDWSCAGGAAQLYAGPVVTSTALTGVRSLTAGSTDHLLAAISFPSTGGNALKDLSSSLELVFSAAQREGGAR